MKYRIKLPLSVEEISERNPYVVVFRYDDTDTDIEMTIIKSSNSPPQ